MQFKNKYKGVSLIIALLTITMLIGNVSAACPTPTSYLSGTTNSICGTLTNNQGSAVTANTPINVTIDFGQYSPIFATDLSNIQIQDQYGNPMNAMLMGNILNWYQQTGLYTSNTVEISFKSPSTSAYLGASTSNYFYIDVAAKSQNNFNTYSWGEACQIGTNYAQYDNGNQIFSLWNCFSGTTTPSGWTNNGFLVSNGVIGASTGRGTFFGTTTTYTVSNTIYILANSVASTGGNLWLGYTLSNQNDGYGAFLSWGANQNKIVASNGHFSASAYANGNYMYTFYFPSATSMNSLQNYGLANVFTGGTNLGAQSLGITTTAAGSNGNVLISQIRSQISFPNGIHPAIVWGALTPVISTTIGFSPASPIVYGTNDIVTATCTPNTDNCNVDSPLGTHLCTGTGSCTFTANYINYGVGTYCFQANDLTGNANSICNNLVINTANAPITCTQAGTSITASLNINSLNGNELVTCNIVSIFSQLANLQLYYNSVSRATGLSVTNTIVWNNQLNNEVANSLGNGNYAANSLAWTTNFLGYIKTNSIMNATAYETTTQGYKWQYNLSKAALSANVVFTINNIYQSSNIINVAQGTGTAQWFNFTYYVARLSANNIAFGANTYIILNMIDGNVLTYNPANQLSQTEYEAIPNIYGATNSFAGIANTLTANLVVPSVLNRQEKVFRNGILYASGVTSVPFGIGGWAAGTYTINALDTVALRNASVTFTIQATAFGQCGIIPAPYYTNANVVALGGAVSNVLIMNVTSETTFAHVGNLINSSGHINAGGFTYNGQLVGFSNTVNWLSGTFCINLVSAQGQSVNITGEFNYNTNAIPRNYQYNNTQVTQGILKTINALTINSLTGINVGQFNIYVINPTLAQVASYVQVFKYYPNTNNYQLVDFIRTGTTGQTQAYLENSKFYSFNIYNSNLVLQGVLSQINMYCITSGGCLTQLQIPNNQSTSFTNYGYIQQSCSYTNLTKTLSCVVTDPTSTTSSYLLNVSKVGLLGNIGICNNLITGASGVLTCTLPDNTNTYIYKLFANTGNNNYQINTGSISFGGVSVYGLLGYFLFFFIVLAFSLMGIEHPILLLVLDTAGIIISFLAGFIGISITLLVDAIVIMLVLAYKLKR